MPSSSSKMLYHDAQEILICNLKLKVAKKAWTEPGQHKRIGHTFDFEFQVQATTVEKELCILNAVVHSTIAPTTDDHDKDDDGDNLFHLNDLVKGIIERETRALAASMTMEELLRGYSSLINHQAVAVFGNVQLELKYLGRLIVYDAYIYVKPQFVDVSLSLAGMFMAEQEDATRTEVLLNVQADQLRQAAALPSQEVEISAENGDKQEVESIERASKTDEIMSFQCQSPEPLIPQVIYSNENTVGHLEQQKKSWPNYTLNTLLFACTMLFSAYMDLSSSASITIKILLVVDIVVFIIVNAVLLIKLPNWGNALAIILWFLLELAMCLLILPFNRWYALAIFTVLFLIIVVALLQPKFQHSVKKYVLPSFNTGDGDTQEDIGDSENDYLNHLFDISNDVATCGGLVTGILGYYSYMVGPITAAGFFFFCTVLLGLYLMMVIAMRAVSPPHAACLAIVLMLLLLLTIIAASISFVHHSLVTM